jgi:glutaredoxin
MMAKSLLENRDIPFETVNIDEDEQAKEFVISEGHRTMPQIYQNGELYVEGGFNGLKEKLNNQVDTTQLGSL